MLSRQIIDNVEKEIISIIANELMDHFGGGLSDERVIRESEAYFLSQKIWERISKSIAGLAGEILEAQ